MIYIALYLFTNQSTIIQILISAVVWEFNNNTINNNTWLFAMVTKCNQGCESSMLDTHPAPQKWNSKGTKPQPGNKIKQEQNNHQKHQTITPNPILHKRTPLSVGGRTETTTPQRMETRRKHKPKPGAWIKFMLYEYPLLE